jgi:hypothetical protein
MGSKRQVDVIDARLVLDEAVVAELDAAEPAVRLDRDFVAKVAADLAGTAFKAPHHSRALKPTHGWGQALAVVVLLLGAVSYVVLRPEQSSTGLASGPPLLEPEMSAVVWELDLGQSPPAPPTAGLAPTGGVDPQAPRRVTDAVAIWLSDRDAATALGEVMGRLRQSSPRMAFTRTLTAAGVRGFWVSYPDHRTEHYVYDAASRRVVRR